MAPPMPFSEPLEGPKRLVEVSNRSPGPKVSAAKLTLAHHLRDDLGRDVPESKVCLRMFSADGQPAKKIEVEAKW